MYNASLAVSQHDYYVNEYSGDEDNNVLLIINDNRISVSLSIDTCQAIFKMGFPFLYFTEIEFRKCCSIGK